MIPTCISDDLEAAAAVNLRTLSMYLGLAIYEDERRPEYWIFAGKGERDLSSLIPAETEIPTETKDFLAESQMAASSDTDQFYISDLTYASEEEKQRRTENKQKRKTNPKS